MSEQTMKLQEGQIKQIQVLEQKVVALKDLKKGSLFRLVTAGVDGKGEVTSDWQVALTDANTENDVLKIQSDRMTMMMGVPKIMNVEVIPTVNPDSEATH